MGEYAIRRSDRAEVKIGTCEDMLYLRYEDRANVQPLANNVDPAKYAHELRFRLPFPDEDNQRIGEYDDPFRGIRLFRLLSVNGCAEDFSDESLASKPGNIQLLHQSGLLLNVPCYHGIKLPEVQAPMKAFWNGKSWSLELTQLRPTPEGVKPIVHCRHCRGKWRYNWSDIWDFVPNDIRPALRVYYEQEQKTAA